jgi:hypothetical protein
MRTPHHRPTKGVLRTEALTSQNSSLSELDEVHAGERVVDLLHRASWYQFAEVDGSEARALEQRDDVRFRVGVVPGDEDHAPAAGLLRIRAEHVGAKRVAGFHDTCAGDEVGD